ncbi:hypothetical protein AVEN_140880-1, partial [Araneus ventricosus]
SATAQESTLLPLLPSYDCYGSWTFRPDNVPATHAVQIANPFKSPPEIKIPSGLGPLNDSSQKEPNIDSSETEMSNESHLSSVKGEYDEYQIEMRIEQEDIY